ncbi:MAG: hypothetical protein EXS08_05805 [Planctomycetes bacterium]|nr:hypothetical protein [Planctomycetota bacterium]
MGSAKVWDDTMRARAGQGATGAPVPVAVAPDELSALVAGIVQVTLDTQLGEYEPGRRSALARELQARLLALFAAPVEAPSARAPAPAPTFAPQQLPTPAVTGEVWTPAPLPPAQRALGLVLEERLARLGGPLASRPDLRERLIALALVSASARSEAPPASTEELGNLDVLQRRAAKLERALQEARAALAYVSGLERIDDGLASIYRVVQGLALDDPQHLRKQDALARIFQANLELRQRPG